jgi:WD40 repeat protein
MDYYCLAEVWLFSCFTAVNNAMLGDDSKLIVWSLQSGEPVQEILCRFNGAIGAICWISPESNEASFVFGCADGSIHVYRRENESVGSLVHSSTPDSHMF